LAITTRGGRLLALPFFRKVSASMSDLLAGRRRQSLFLLGLLNGLLPCGLVYMALTAAVAQGDVLRGTLLMVFFGAGTVPAMVAIPYASGWISFRFRNAARTTVPYFVAFTGLLLVLRGMGLGIPYISPSFDDAAASCHNQANRPVTLHCSSP
jgi:sulfite exporter TauE/SafE